MRLLNTNTLPPGGYPYVQPETGMKFQGMVGFSQQVAAIVAHRRKNQLQRSNAGDAAQDLHDYTCARLGNNPEFCSDGSVVIKKKSLGRLWEGAKHAAEAVSQVATAGAILSDWLGDGAEPVSQELAQIRSDICTGRLNGNPCPKNQASGWRWSMEVAKIIQSQMARKSEFGLKVEGEDQLGTCKACGCFLKLKNWVPFQHIYAHTSDDQMSKFPAHCWIVKEHKETQIPA